MTLTVSDDGDGFELASAGMGTGLASMKDARVYCRVMESGVFFGAFEDGCR